MSPNAEYFPIPPSTSDELRSIHSLGQPRYAYDTYFYLALVPLSVEFDGPLLGCLSPTSVALEPTVTKRGNTFFQLTRTLQTQWQSCESIILEVQRRLTRRAGLLYLETSVPPPPTAFGYAECYHSRSEALEHVKKALSAFTARLAFLSYLVLKEEAKGLDTWSDLALHRDPLPLAICNAFRLSWVSDWTVPRVGAFVDIARQILRTGGSHWHQDIRLFLSKGTCVPLWFTFTSDDGVFQPACEDTRSIYHAFNPSILVRLALADAATTVFDTETCDVPLNKLPWNHCYSAVYLPARSLPSALVVRRRKFISTEFTIKFARGSRITLTPTTTVPPSHGSLWHKRFKFRNRQLCGETYEDFMDRQTQECIQLEPYETPQEREARLCREDLNRFQPVPTGGGPAVYLWEFVPSYHSHLRTRVLPSQVAELWEATTTSSRVYNAFRDEYDVRQTDLPQCNDTDTGLTDSVTDSLPVQTNEPATPSPQLLSSLIKDVLGPPNTIDFTAVNIPNAHWQDTLRDRFGYHGSLKVATPPDYSAGPTGSGILLALSTSTGHRTSSTTLCDRNVPSDVVEFVTMLKDSTLPPARLFDLADPCATNVPQFIAGIRMLEGDHAYGVAPAAVSQTDGLAPCPSVYISFNSATSVLHAHRLSLLTSQQGLVQGMLSRGMRFLVLQRAPPQDVIGSTDGFETELNIDKRPIGMGVLPHGLQLGLHDYVAYNATLRTLLAGPLGVAALQSGGILWRLAIGVRGEVVPVQEVLLSTEGATHAATIQGAEYVGHKISLRDAYKIVGTYRVLNGACFTQSSPITVDGYLTCKAHSTEQASVISWWPLPDVWTGSEMDVGFWSSKAEQWFQKRCAELLEGKAKAKTNHTWRKDLKRLNKDASAVHTTVEHYSRLAL